MPELKRFKELTQIKNRMYTIIKNGDIHTVRIFHTHPFNSTDFYGKTEIEALKPAIKYLEDLK